MGSKANQHPKLDKALFICTDLIGNEDKLNQFLIVKNGLELARIVHEMDFKLDLK